ncbi:hypothetical protein [Algoriphagus sp. A40]|uniref:hypothetical protein n=1 Tax=Algoriphagus sp. A40 TaxID=1945863 RepID=UPI0009CF3B63|nr:hypothetical protein [Algoriphagus sp. A40]OOG77126.1 hypothetical protein B0E43_05875 [Algoriphagus sp. A40]
MKSKFLPILLTGMTLGTAWAIRGQFGHEQGAAWAGAIGCVFLVLFSNKKEWISGGLKAVLLGAIGWGMGGMMSYGMVVGYGKSDSFLNVSYGLLMMFIIGGLYGFLGGGLFGLGLQESSSGKKIAWHRLLVEMCAGAIIFYYFVVEELGILMTPPRSEAWGICAGAAIALAYFCTRNSYSASLKVAIYSGLGAGFGFAFGEFLMVLGMVSEIKFNFWNVMEYSLGFFGGIGMAYSALTANFETKKSELPVRSSSIAWPVFGLMVLIPFIVWHQSFLQKDLLPAYEKAIPGNSEFWASMAVLLAFLGFLITSISGFIFSQKWQNSSEAKSFDLIKWVGLILFGMYLVYTFLITGSYLSIYRPEQFLYLVNFGFVVTMIRYCTMDIATTVFQPKKAGYLLVGIVVTLLILAAVAISTHGELKGANDRFGAEKEVRE